MSKILKEAEQTVNNDKAKKKTLEPEPELKTVSKHGEIKSGAAVLASYYLVLIGNIGALIQLENSFTFLLVAFLSPLATILAIYFLAGQASLITLGYKIYSVMMSKALTDEEKLSQIEKLIYISCDMWDTVFTKYLRRSERAQGDEKKEDTKTK